MRKYLTFVFISLTILSLLSWGYKGHRAIALIAQNHLTPNAKTAIADLLNGETIEDASTWADELRSDPKYRNTSSWHFLNLPSGLTYKEFESNVTSQTKDNVYAALIKAQATLKQPNTTKAEKQEALKFLIHLVGDAHQPMHVAGAADKGGNTIQVRFDNKGTNLHTLWDSRLIDYSGLSESQLVAKIEKEITPSDLAEYGKDNPMIWLYESYSASTLLYKGIQQSNKIDQQYYNNNIALVEERLVAAGLRLASILNEIFKGPVTSTPSNITIIDVPLDANMKFIDGKDAPNHIGELVSITDKVYGTKDMGSMILVNLGAEYPNQILTVVLRGEARAKAKDIEGKTVRVEGKVVDYKGKPQIVITNPSDIAVVNLIIRPGVRGG